MPRELHAPTNPTPLFWIFETGFIEGLPWDPDKWHWQGSPPMGDSPFFGFFTKRGYRNAKKPSHTPGIFSFIQQLHLQNSTVPQVIMRIWHNSRPHKVGTLIWLTLNHGLPVGTWLQCMGISPSCKVCDTETHESLQHCLLECPHAKHAWEAFQCIWLN
jgi:hypothetical protein